MASGQSADEAPLRSQQDQFDDLLHLVWTLEAWWRIEDHIDHVVEGESE